MGSAAVNTISGGELSMPWYAVADDDNNGGDGLSSMLADRRARNRLRTGNVDQLTAAMTTDNQQRMVG